MTKLKAEMLQLENRLHISESRCVVGQEKSAVEDRRGKSSDVRRCQKPPVSTSVSAAVLSATRPANRSVSSSGQACNRSRCISGGDGVSPIYPNESSPPLYRVIRTSASANTRKKTVFGSNWCAQILVVETWWCRLIAFTWLIWEF